MEAKSDTYVRVFGMLLRRKLPKTYQLEHNKKTTIRSYLRTEASRGEWNLKFL